MISVRSREVEKFRSFLSQQSIFREIGSVTTSSQNDRTVSFVLLPSILVFYSNNLVTFFDELFDVCFLDDFDTIRFTFSDIFELVHECDSDRHSGELSASSVSALEGVTTETRDL